MESSVDGVHGKATGAFNASFSPKDVADYYSRWAPNYDQELDDESVCKAPDSVAEKMSEVYTVNREGVRILDVAAGTGLVGGKLYKYGFRNIDGLDPSEGMLLVCKTKRLYKNLICEFMTDDVPVIKTDTYDCIVSSGGMGDGHIPRKALKEMIRVVRPGTMIAITAGSSHFVIATGFTTERCFDNVYVGKQPLARTYRVPSTSQRNSTTDGVNGLD